MALPKQIVDLPLTVGLDTKSDPKVARGLLTMQNGEIQQLGAVRKRRAFAPLSKTVINGGYNGQTSGQTGYREEASRFVSGYGIYSAGKQLLAHGRDELSTSVARNGNTGALLAAYLPERNAWMPVYIHTPVAARIIRSSESDDTGEDNVSAGAGYRVYEHRTVPVGGTQEILFTVCDEATNKVLWRYDIYGAVATPEIPQGSFVLKGGSKKYVGLSASAGASNVYMVLWDPATPDTPPAVSTPFNDYLAGSRIFDCALNIAGDALLVVYKRTGTNDIIIRKLDADGTEVATALVVASTPISAITIFPIISGTTERYAVVCQDSAAGACRVIIVSTALALVANTTPAAGFTASNWWQVTGCQMDIVTAGAFSDGAFVVAVSDAAATQEDRLTRFNTFTYGGALIGGAAVQLEHTEIASKLFNYNGRAYIMCAYNSALQKTYFLYSVSTLEALDAGSSDDLDYPALCCKVMYGRALAPRYRTSYNAKVVALGGGKFLVSGRRQDRADAVSGGSGTVDSPVAIEFDLEAAAAHPVSFGPGHILPGGVVAALDTSFQELGFHIYPENITVADQAAGAMGAGTFSYVVVAEWIDRLGQIHRSTPSVATSITQAVNRQTRTTVRYNSQIQVPRHMSPTIKYHLYRTEAGGSIYYRTASLNVKWVAGSATFTIDDNVTDATLITRDRLYTDGGALPAVAPPSGNILVADDQRLYLVPFDDPTTIWYTKPKEEAYAPEFVDGQYVRIEGDGDNTGLAVQDGSKVVFKQRAIYVFVGEGPNALGIGEFSRPRKLPFEIGCIDHRSVVTYRDGTMFRSEAGYYLLDRSLQIQPIGLPVARYAGEEVCGAIVVPNRDEVWIALKHKRTVLVYNYLAKVWGTHELERSVAGITYNDGVVCFISPDGTVFKMDESRPTEEPFKMNTAWYKAAGPQGYQKLFWIHLLGDLDAAFMVTLHYDYKDGVEDYSQTVKFAAKKGRKMVRLKPAKRKCVAVRLDIEQTGKLSVDMGVNGLSLALAGKGRLARLASAETK